MSPGPESATANLAGACCAEQAEGRCYCRGAGIISQGGVRGREWRLAEGLHLLEQSLRETAEHLASMALPEA